MNLPGEIPFLSLKKGVFIKFRENPLEPFRKDVYNDRLFLLQWRHTYFR